MTKASETRKARRAKKALLAKAARKYASAVVERMKELRPNV